MAHIIVRKYLKENEAVSYTHLSVETFEQYLVGKNGRDGAAILTAMMPALLEDAEFNSHFVSYKEHMDNGYPDLDLSLIHIWNTNIGGDSIGTTKRIFRSAHQLEKMCIRDSYRVSFIPHYGRIFSVYL